MHHRLRSLSLFAIAVVGLTAMLLTVPRAAAQDGTAPAATAVVGDATSEPAAPTPTVGSAESQATAPTPAPESSTGENSNQNNALLVILALGTGLLWLGLLITFFQFGMQRYYDSARLLGVAGRIVTTRSVSAVVSAQTLHKTDGASPTKEFALEGPMVITKGTSAPYTTVDDDGNPVDATWKIVSTDGIATLDNSQGSKVNITAKSVGQFVLKVTAGNGYIPLPEPIVIEVKALETKGVQLAFFGAGSGSLLLAALILSVALALGLVDKLSGEAISTLLGTLAGYIFGTRQNEVANRGGGDGGSDSGA